MPQWYYRQSGVIAYREKDGEIEVLLITSRKRKRWIIPKGIVERDLSPAESAAKEAMEEAGIEGVVSANPIGEYQYPKWDGICTVAVYLLRVTKVHKDWPERKIRKRKWLSFEEAASLVKEEELKEMITQVLNFIEQINI
jgi:8-oxo-dGTP pyrophosphatase MutT (NUDIX family)